MKKVLLVFDDYNEMTTTDVYLKKVGFDVVGIGSETKIADQLLIFNPDVVVALGRTQKVSSLSVGQKLRENHRFFGKAILILPPGYRPTTQDLSRVRMDATLESPVEPTRLIEILAKFSNQDAALLIEKFRKATLTDPTLREKFKAPVEPRDDHSRVKKYQKFLNAEKIDTKTTTFNKQDVKMRQRDLREDWDFDELEKIDELKRQFADALFKKT